ncbi:MAG TPA: autotransporter-associated beta strand repeat-containing protein, partial [Chthoniobacteraceae bacterium]|nr:autotransporter-associated beta strand repeat-containing protein [Chthoniobacteraceae bacterium]
MAGGELRAADTWLGVTSTGGTFLWNTAGNWSGGAPAGGVVEFGTAGAGAPNSFDNITGLSLSGFLFDSGAPAYTVSGTTIILTGSVINNGTSVQTINDNITFSEATNNIFTNGIGNVTFGGLITATPSGGQGAGWAFDAALTTFNGGFTSNTTGGRTLVWSGTGNILLASTFGMTNATTNALGLIYQGSGTLDLTSGTANGSISGTLAASGVTVQIASGTTPISGTSGNSTLQITGNYTIGSAGAATLTIKGGNGTTTTQGALNLEDASINTLFINSTTAGATVLTMGQSAAAATILDMDVGNNSADSIVLGSGLKASIGTGGVIVNLNGIGGLTTSGTYTLINAQATTLAASEFTLNTTTGNLGGFTSFGLIVTSGSLLQVTVGGANPTPLNAYWGGSQGSGGNGTWITFTGGVANNSNWLTAQSGGMDTHQSPGSVTNVFLMADSGSNLNTNIGASTTIESLNFTGTDATVSTGSAITVGGANLTLTINAAGVSGNTAGNGLTTGAGAGADTISTNVALGGNQTWTLNASPTSPLTVTGTISGAHALAVSGSGELILGGNDTFTNGLTINGSAIVVLNNVGALNSTTPDSVSFGAGSSGTLDLNGKSVTISTLSTNATPGSPVIQNANGSTSGTLTVSQSGSSTYAGILADGAGSASLGFTLASGTLTLRGANTYTGATNINGGLLNIYGSLGAGSLVNVNGGILSGTGGTVNGAVTVKSGGELMPGTASAPGTLTLTNGLTVNSSGIAAFNILGGSSDFLNITGGNLTFNSGAILEVTGGLSASGTYTLITGTSAPSLTGVTLEDLNGNSLATNDPHYTVFVSGNSILLGITPANSAIPNITITSPANGTRVMTNTLNIAISGSVGNTGVQPLNATLSDGGGNLAVGGFSPNGGVFTTGTGAVTIFGGTIGNSGTVLGLQNYKVTVSDTAASPTSATATGTLDVLGNRQVSATGATIGSIHVGLTGSASTTLSSTAPDNQATRVTVADGGVDSGANGLTVTGGNPSGTFNGSLTDIRTVTGAFGSIGLQSGTVTLTTTGEGLAGESPINVGVGYTAQVFSGKASWTSATGGSWITNGNWGDTQAADLNGAGAPGLAGAASIGDTATFNDVAGQAGVSTVSLTGTTVTLAGITFNSTNGYTISGGTIALQGTATPIAVSTGLDTISSVLTGSGAGMNKTGSGTLVLGAANNYTGSTTIGNGVVKANVAGALPAGTILTFGDNSNDSGQLVLVGNESVGSIASIGSGISSIVGGTTTVSVLTLNIGAVPGSTYTFTGNVGGAGTNQNNISLIVTGTSMEILSGALTYTGSTAIGNGAVLQTSNMLGNSSPIALLAGPTSPVNGGVWQPVLSGSTNYNFTLGTTAAGNVSTWSGGGFAAFGGPLVLTANG